MKERPNTNRFFWIRGLFWVALAALVAVSYLEAVKRDEKRYNDFIGREWTTHTVTYTVENSPLIGEYMMNLTTDQAGNVWIGTDTALTVVTPEGSWSTYLVNGKGGFVQSVAFDRFGRTWAGSFEGLYVLEPDGQWTTYDEKSKTVYEHYTSSDMVIDRFDRIWVANNDGLRMFLPDGTKTVFIKGNSGLQDDYITGLAEDSQGNIWIGTRTKGAAVYDTNDQWKTYQVGGSSKEVFDNWVTTVFAAPQDHLWVGTEKGKLSMLSPDGAWTTYNTYQLGIQADPNYNDPQINALAMDKQGRLWIGTWDALFGLDPDGNWHIFNEVNTTLHPDFIKALTVDDKNRLWIATFEEIIVLDLNQPLPQTVSNEWIRQRNLLRTPLELVNGIKSFLLMPLDFYKTYFEPLRVGYLGSLLLILPALVGVYWGYNTRNRILLKTSGWVAFIACLAVIWLWVLSLVIAILFYRD